MMDEIIVPNEETEAPAYDFGSGELADKVNELKAQLGLLDEPEHLTPEAMAARSEADKESVIKGSDINWDDYELQPNFAHFYPRAEFKNTPQGPRWLVKITEFLSESKQYLNKNMGKNEEPLGLGDYLTVMINGGDKWQIASVTPNGSGFAGILLQRQVTVVLPDPVEIVKETTVAAPTDAELVETEATSLEWAGLNQEEPDAEVSETPSND